MFGFYRSSVGKKAVVAVTGLVLFGFVVLHMLGNLKAFLGVDPLTGVHHLDTYALFLREMGHEFLGKGTALWLTRIVLLVCLIVHVSTVIQLQAINAAARPEQYVHSPHRDSTYAARSMFWGGLFLLIFVVYHILHFTTGTLYFQGFVEGRVYQNVSRAFVMPSILVFYLSAMAVLGFHLYHGAWSLFQTLGLDGPKTNLKLRNFAKTMAVVVALGFISVPLAIFLGLLPSINRF